MVHQVPLSMGFSRQEYWSELPLSCPGNVPDPGIEPMSPALAGRFLTTEPLGKPPLGVSDMTVCGLSLCISRGHCYQGPLSVADFTCYHQRILV